MNFGIERHFFENGLIVGFLDIPHSPHLCIHIRGLAGSNYENDSEIGTAHLLEHIIVDSPAFADLSGQAKIVAICSRDDVIYGIKLPSENILKILPLIRTIFESDLPGLTNLEKHKMIVNNEITRHRSNPEKLITRAIYRILYPDTRLAVFNSGTPESIEQTTPETLRKFYFKMYQPKYFVVTITGNISTENKAMLLNYLSKIYSSNTKSKPERTYRVFNQNGCKASQIIKIGNTGMEHIKYDFHSVTFRNDYKYAFCVTAEIFNTQLALLQEKEGIYRTSCTNFSTGSYGIFDFYINSNTQKASEVHQLIFENLQRITPSDKNVQAAKSSILNRFLLSIDKISNLTDYSSEILLHGNTQQDMNYEINKIRNVDVDQIEYILQNLRNQSPKITVLTC